MIVVKYPLLLRHKIKIYNGIQNPPWFYDLLLLSDQCGVKRNGVDMKKYVLVKIVFLCFYLIFYSDVVIMHFTKNVEEKKFDSWSDIDPISRTVRELLSVMCFICFNLSSEICAVESEDHGMDFSEHEWGI